MLPSFDTGGVQTPRSVIKLKTTLSFPDTIEYRM